MDLMLDLETLGTQPGCVILQIGARWFNPYKKERGMDFLQNIILESSLAAGFKIEADTLKWWMEQEEEARSTLFTDPKSALSVLANFNDFAQNAQRIWCHATFDMPILMQYYKTFNLNPTFHYRATRDLRTLVDLADIDLEGYKKSKIPHNALDDCAFQVRYVWDCFDKLRGLK